MPNFVIIYPHHDEKALISLYNKLELKPFDNHIIIIEERDKGIVQFLKHFANLNLNYSGIIDSCIEPNLYKTIHKMGGKKGDKLFFLRENSIIPHTVAHNVKF